MLNYVYVWKFDEKDFSRAPENKIQDDIVNGGFLLTYTPGKYSIRTMSDLGLFWLITDGGSLVGVFHSEEEARLAAAIAGAECADELEKISPSRQDWKTLMIL